MQETGVSEIRRLQEENIRLKNELAKLLGSRNPWQDTASELQLLEEICESTGNGVVALAAIRTGKGKITDFRYLYINPKATAILEKPSTEIKGKSLRQVYQGFDKEPLIDSYKRVLETGKSEISEFCFVEGKTTSWIRSTTAPLRDGILVTYEDVTMQKASERSLRESQLFVRKISKVTPGLITVVNPATGQYLFVSEAVESILGYKPADFFSGGTNLVNSIIHPDDLDAVLEQYRETVSEGNGSAKAEYPVHELEYRIRHKDGRWVWLYTYRAVFSKTDNGRVDQIINISIDITSRKEAEERLIQNEAFLYESREQLKRLNDQLDQKVQQRTAQLRRSEANLKEAQRISHIGNWEFELGTGKITWSDETFRIHGLIPSDHSPSYEEMRCLFVDPSSLDAKIDDAINKGIPYELDTPIKRPDGEVRYVHIIAKPVIEASGRCNRLYGTILDITERKEVEDALRQQQAEFRSLVAALSEAVWESDPEGRIDDLPIWREITGQDEEEIKGYGWMDAIHPSDRKLVESKWQHAILNKVNYYSEYRVLTRNKEYRWYRASGVPIFNDQGEIRKWIGVWTDIHTTKVAHEELEIRVKERTLQLEEKNRELNRSNQELEHFAYIASHDLKEPLRMVSSYTQLLQQKYQDKLDDVANEFISYAVGGAARMSDLINDLLKYSRIGRLKEMLEPVDMNLVVEIVTHNLENKIRENNGTVLFENLPVIKTMQSYMVQLFQNLVGNAIKFHGDKPPVVNIRCERKDNWWHFCVSDNGIGIESRHLDRIFDIFQRLHESDKYPGTGIGLAVCKKIVEFFGGEIYAKSEPGQGTTFCFTLPA